MPSWLYNLPQRHEGRKNSTVKYHLCSNHAITIKLKRYLELNYFSLLILIPIVLIILPADFFDHGKSICLSLVLFHKTCLGCGITRAIQHIIHFDFAVGYAFNKLSVIVFPVLVFVWARELIRAYRKIKIRKV